MLTKCLKKLPHPSRQIQPPPTTTITPVDQTALLRVFAVLHQTQHSRDDDKILSRLDKLPFDLSREFFLQVCNRFTSSWRPVYRFFRYAQTRHGFSHSPTTFNRAIDVMGKSKNIPFLWELFIESVESQMSNERTLCVAVKALAEARELKKCVTAFHLMKSYDLWTLNRVVETLCGSKLVEEAVFVVNGLKAWVAPNEVTYGFLVVGFCRGGDLVGASKVWNLIIGEGLEPDVGAYDEMVDTLMKQNRFLDALKMFESMRVRRRGELGLSSYQIVIKWLCKRGEIRGACVVFGEVVKRGVWVDDNLYGTLIYGLLVGGRVREAWRVVEGIGEKGLEIHNGLIKGLLSLGKASEATKVFGEMIERGCEPNMHTYVMLLKGHLGEGRDTVVDVFGTIFVGGLVKVGKMKEARRFVEGMVWGDVGLPRFDYVRFLHLFSNEEGVVMFEEVGNRLGEVGLVDLGFILSTYGERMATKERRRKCRWKG
ncbi:putative pentatricopeptide repeat-containing protein [Acorus gramineus]|uniref:Pentatricopeptide repeat-containing protein n=2 Tax=Acorus TaxID=4464 RepID=A0AAV9AZD8_ACOGR|nr:putative pentatricopeptide repeat-containing protein [Acorus gramineus]